MSQKLLVKQSVLQEKKSVYIYERSLDKNLKHKNKTKLWQFELFDLLCSLCYTESLWDIHLIIQLPNVNMID